MKLQRQKSYMSRLTRTPLEIIQTNRKMLQVALKEQIEAFSKIKKENILKQAKFLKEIKHEQNSFEERVKNEHSLQRKYYNQYLQNKLKENHDYKISVLKSRQLQIAEKEVFEKEMLDNVETLKRRMLVLQREQNEQEIKSKEDSSSLSFIPISDSSIDNTVIQVRLQNALQKEVASRLKQERESIEIKIQDSTMENNIEFQEKRDQFDKQSESAYKLYCQSRIRNDENILNELKKLKEEENEYIKNFNSFCKDTHENLIAKKRICFTQISQEDLSVPPATDLSHPIKSIENCKKSSFKPQEESFNLSMNENEIRLSEMKQNVLVEAQRMKEIHRKEKEENEKNAKLAFIESRENDRRQIEEQLLQVKKARILSNM